MKRKHSDERFCQSDKDWNNPEASSVSRQTDCEGQYKGFFCGEEYLLEIMAKTGYLTEKQSQPIIDDCRSLKALITERANEMKPPAAPSSR